MEKRVKITREESEAVEILFNRFSGYCNILGYLAKYGSIDTSLFDKKWAEAVEINTELNKLKETLDRKYHPQDNIQYTQYEFDFFDYQMVYLT